MKTTLKVLLFLSVIVLGYLCTMSILGPIQFDEQKKSRDRAVVKRLIDIRKAQVAFLNAKGGYAPNFDTLTYFLNHDSLAFLIKQGTLTDEQLESGLTEAEAYKRGIIVRDTFHILAKDTIFGRGYNADSLRFVPGTNIQFEMGATEIPTASGIFMHVFEAKTPYDVYLNGLNRQEVINLKEKAEDLGRYPGLQVGSLREVNNNAGNWE